MMITDTGIEQYVENHTSGVSDILQKVERETYLKSLYPRMLSGKVLGGFLSMISNMVQPQYILEIGTFTGYSAICLTEGLKDNGQLHTIEINEELKEQNDATFKAAGISNKIVPHFGNALEIIPNLGTQFDLVFIDADKVNYSNYYELSLDKLNPGGFILADNVLWSGKVVADNPKRADKETIAVKEFNDLVQKDHRVKNVMLPLRDGITIIQKIC